MTIRVLLILALMLVAFRAEASGELSVRPSEGTAPLELRPGRGFQWGRFVIENTGTTPLEITHVGLRAPTDKNPRLPSGIVVDLATVNLPFELAPAERRELDVRWSLKNQRQRELYGHVVVRSADGADAALGIHAERSRPLPWLTRHSLSWLLWLPLLGAAITLMGKLPRFQRRGRLRFLVLGVGLVQLALVGWLASELDPWLSRYDGNEGYQLVERLVLLPHLGIEYALGVDGVSAPLLALVPVLVVAASLAGGAVERRSPELWALVLVLDASLIGAFASLDLALLLVCWAIAALSVLFLVGSFQQVPSRSVRVRLGVAMAVSLVLGGFAFGYLSSHAPGALLLDGSPASQSFSLLELMQVDFAHSGLQIGGLHALKVVFPALLFGCAILLCLGPLGGWLVGSVHTAPVPVAIVVGGGILPLGGYIALRVGYGVVGDAVVWASPTLATLGLVALAWGALGALLQRKLPRLLAHTSMCHGGLVLLALSGTTAIAVEGLVLLLVGHALAIALGLGVARALEARLGTSRWDALGGVAREVPELGASAAVGAAAAMGLPGTLLFLAHLTIVLGSFPNRPVASVVAALLLALVAVAHVRCFSQSFLGAFPKHYRSSLLLEAHGGRMPALSHSETWLLLPLAGLLLVLGWWPTPILHWVGTTALDLAERVDPPGPAQIVLDDARPDLDAVARR